MHFRSDRNPVFWTCRHRYSQQTQLFPRLLASCQKINLSKEVAGLKKVVVGLGWDAAKQGLFGHKPNIDCDASAIILGKGNKYRGVVYYGDRSAEDGCVYHHGDNLTGDGAGDDEQITVNLDKMPEDVQA